MPDLLFLSQRLPYQPIKSEKIHAFHDLKYLTRHYDIHLGCLADNPADLQYVNTIRTMCRDIHVAPFNPRVARLACLRSLLTNKALSVTFFRNCSLAKWIRNFMETVRPAVAFVYPSNIVPYIFDLLRAGTRLVNLVDVNAEKWHALAKTRRGPMRFVYQREWCKVAVPERRIAEVCDLSVFVSDAEAALFDWQVPEHSECILGVSNSVDHRHFDPAPKSRHSMT